MIRLALAAAALLLMAACQTPDPTYRDLDQMGRNYQRDTQASATPQNAEQATAADVCHASRTQDFSPERLNIRVGPDGKVATIECF